MAVRLFISDILICLHATEGRSLTARYMDRAYYREGDAINADEAVVSRSEEESFASYFCVSVRVFISIRLSRRASEAVGRHVRFVLVTVNLNGHGSQAYGCKCDRRTVKVVTSSDI